MLVTQEPVIHGYRPKVGDRIRQIERPATLARKLAGGPTPVRPRSNQLLVIVLTNGLGNRSLWRFRVSRLRAALSLDIGVRREDRIN
jgi:hypothetical protein